MWTGLERKMFLCFLNLIVWELSTLIDKVLTILISFEFEKQARTCRFPPRVAIRSPTIYVKFYQFSFKLMSSAQIDLGYDLKKILVVFVLINTVVRLEVRNLYNYEMFLAVYLAINSLAILAEKF